MLDIISHPSPISNLYKYAGVGHVAVKAILEKLKHDGVTLFNYDH